MNGMRLLASAGLLAALHGCASPDQQTPASTLVITEPAPASFLPEEALVVEGWAAEVDLVAVEGETVPLEGGHFETQVELQRGIRLVEAAARETDGDTLYVRHGVLVGDLRAPDAVVTEALQVRVSPQGFAFLADTVETMLTPDAVFGAAAGSMPDPGGLLDGLTVSLRDLSFDHQSVSLVPDERGLAFSVALQDLALDVGVSGSFFAESAEVTATTLVVSGVLSLAAGSGQHEVAVLESDAVLTGLDYDVSALPIDGWFAGGLKSLVEGAVEDALAQTVPSALEGALGGLMTGSDFGVQGGTFSVSPSFRAIEIDEDGLELALDVGLDAEGEVPEGAGVLRAKRTVPDLGGSSIAVAISDDIVNEALFEAWRGGLLNLHMSTEDGLDPALFAALGATSGSVTTDARLPPVLVAAEGGSFSLQVAELLVDVYSPGARFGDQVRIAVSLHATANVAIEGGKLALRIDDVQSSLTVRDSNWGARDSTLSSFFEHLVPIDDLVSVVSMVRVPVPAVAGVDPSRLSLGRDAGGSHIVVAVD